MFFKRLLRSDPSPKWSASVRGCKWLGLHHRIHDFPPAPGNTIPKFFFFFFWLIPFLCSGLYKNYRSGVRGCKWFRLRHQIHNLTTAHYHTSPQIFFEFFYLVRFLRSDLKKKIGEHVLLAANGSR